MKKKLLILRLRAWSTTFSLIPNSKDYRDIKTSGSVSWRSLSLNLLAHYLSSLMQAFNSWGMLVSCLCVSTKSWSHRKLTIKKLLKSWPTFLRYLTTFSSFSWIQSQTIHLTFSNSRTDQSLHTTWDPKIKRLGLQNKATKVYLMLKESLCFQI